MPLNRENEQSQSWLNFQRGLWAYRNMMWPNVPKRYEVINLFHHYKKLKPNTITSQ